MKKKDKHSGKVTWQSPSNIAFIKYWGKKGDQIPCNPSLSMTLKNSYTETSIKYYKEKKTTIKYRFEGKKDEIFEERVQKYLKKIEPHIPFLSKYSLNIDSRNTFPHSTGIASSASAFSALALCLCSIEDELSGHCSPEEEFCNKASFLARLGSGSASRSMYGPYAIWGKTNADTKSDDTFAIQPSFKISPFYRELCDAILIVNSKGKKVSSSTGHELMKDHPFAKARFKKAAKNLEILAHIMQNGDQKKFIELLEHEAFALHAMMMVSSSPTILLHPNSLFVIDLIRNFREKENLKIGFTIDAGPNIHLYIIKMTKKR
jgi:diphosphomevalonate decarboxylase